MTRDSGWCGGIRRGSGSVVTWRWAQMVPLSAQGMDVAAIAKVAFTSDDRVRDVIRNFNADGFGLLYPRYKGGHPPKFTLGQRREIKKIASPSQPSTTYRFPLELSKLAEFLVAEGVVDDISHEPAHHAPRGGRQLSAPEDLEGLQGPALRGQEGASRALVRDRRRRRGPERRRPGGDLLRGSVRAAQPAAPAGDGTGPQSAAGGKSRTGAAAAAARDLHPHRRVRHCSPPTSWAQGSSTGISSTRKTRTRFLEFCRYLRSLYPPATRIAIICDNFSPHLNGHKTPGSANLGDGEQR